MTQPGNVPPSPDSPPRWSTASCRSCHAPIIWAQTVAGARIPIDAEPVDVNRGRGSVLLHARPGLAPFAEIVANKGLLFGRRWVYRPHMETCTHAARYRRRAGAPARPAPLAAALRTPDEYEVLRRYAQGRSLEAIRIQTSTTLDYVRRTLARTCSFDRRRARDLVARYDETHRP